MSIGNVDEIMTRIKSAEPNSPIAVFDMGGVLNAVFCNTVETRRWILNSIWPLVGVFYNRMDLKDVKCYLDRKAVNHDTKCK